MYLGKLMELSPARSCTTSRSIRTPRRCWRRSRSPIRGPTARVTRAVLGGEPPNPITPPSGCRFHTRCPHATEICSAVEPPLYRYAGGHLAACHHPQNVTAEEISRGDPLAAQPAHRRRGRARAVRAQRRGRPTPGRARTIPAPVADGDRAETGPTGRRRWRAGRPPAWLLGLIAAGGRPPAAAAPRRRRDPWRSGLRRRARGDEQHPARRDPCGSSAGTRATSSARSPPVTPAPAHRLAGLPQAFTEFDTETSHQSQVFGPGRRAQAQPDAGPGDRPARGGGGLGRGRKPS